MHLSLIAQYVTGLSVETLIRPYQNKEALSIGIDVQVDTQQLPEADHWRVVLEVRVEGLNASKDKCFLAKAAREAIVVTDAPEEARARVLAQGVLVYLFASLRSDLSASMMATGYGPVVLPPLTSDQLQAMLARHA